MQTAPTSLNNHYPFSPVPLSYSYSDFEPRFGTDTVRNHYENIYLGYIDDLNRLLEPYPEYQNMTLIELITNNADLPDDIRLGIYDSAGGVYNHEVIFGTITPYPSAPRGIVPDEIDASFGSAENMFQTISGHANAMSGSGHVVLAKRNNGALILLATENETTVLEDNLYPILIFDLWEHAYANDFGSIAEYINEYYSIINWDEANERYNTPYDFEQPLTANN